MCLKKIITSWIWSAQPSCLYFCFFPLLKVSKAQDDEESDDSYIQGDDKCDATYQDDGDEIDGDDFHEDFVVSKLKDP